ncbi:hypothetical protein PENDEC_c040G02831 [Penicillium decumbens]|uniref:Uncharacterized protein n=1 Tax=Penicillium decumbens TaxID=69771 RepID=A0A1V6NRB8_PENDC|nr:hypothetical protein PENDEC_c040G02831 [Penicillium decumbens]
MNNEFELTDGQYLGANIQKILLYPWKMIDYYLYLTRTVELGRTSENRLDETHLLTTNGFFQIDYDKLYSCITTPSINYVAFLALPVPSAGLPDRKIILGFDLKSHHLQAHLVDHASRRLADLGRVWSRAELIIDIQADRFLDILVSTLDGHLEILRVGMIGYFQESTRELHSALDLVIAIQFGQFLSDFAELLGEDKVQFTKFYQRYDEQMRDLLLKGSTRAWFAARDGLSIEQYRQREMNQPVLFDLFYEPSDVPSSKLRLLQQQVERPGESFLIPPARDIHAFADVATAIPAIVMISVLMVD